MKPKTPELKTPKLNPKTPELKTPELKPEAPELKTPNSFSCPKKFENEAQKGSNMNSHKI